MQPDGGLVEHVQQARQPATQLGCQAYALQLAPAQGQGRTAQAQVAESDPLQKGQSQPGLLERCSRDRALPAGQLSFQPLKALQGGIYAEIQQLCEPHPGQRGVQR